MLCGLYEVQAPICYEGIDIAEGDRLDRYGVDTSVVKPLD